MYNENYEVLATLPPTTEEGEKELITPKINLVQCRSYLNHTLGEVLTIVDSSISDVVQRKAMKDLIKGRFWDSLRMIQDETIRQPISPEVKTA